MSPMWSEKQRCGLRVFKNGKISLLKKKVLISVFSSSSQVGPWEKRLSNYEPPKLQNEVGNQMKLSLHCRCLIFLTVEWRQKKVGDDLTVPFTSNSECFQLLCLLFEWISYFVHGRPNNETIFFSLSYFNSNAKPPKNNKPKKREKKEFNHPKKSTCSRFSYTLRPVQLHKFLTCLLAPSTIAASSSDHVLNCSSGYLIIHFMKLL